MILNKVVILEPQTGSLIEENEPYRAHQEHAEGEQRHLEINGHGQEAARVTQPPEIAALVLVGYLNFGGRVHPQQGLHGQTKC